MVREERDYFPRMRPVTLVVAAVLALLSPAAGARAQFGLEFGGAAEANPVLSSKDFDAICDAVRLDAAQRQIAGTSFDDAQDRMFEAKRRADAVRARTGTNPTDDQSIAEREQARKALAQEVLNQLDNLFRAMVPVIRADQREDLERERLAAKRRAIRAMLGGSGVDGAAQVDVEGAMRKADVAAERAAPALAQLGAYRQRIGSLLQRMLDDSIAQPRRGAKARQPAPAEDAPEGGVSLESVRRMAEAQAAQRETVTQLAAAHRDALGLVATHLSPAELAKVREQVLRRVWPRTAMDPLSPATAIDQLLRKELDAAARTAIEAIRDAWQPRWWSLTLRMTAAEDALRGNSPILNLGAPPDEGAARAKLQLRELREERSAADRDAWKALAGADPSRKDFHLGMAKMPARDTLFGVPPGLPADGGTTPEGVNISLAEAVEGGANVQMGAAVSIATVITSVEDGVPADGPGGEGEDTMVFTADADDLVGGGMIMVAGEDGPITFGDRFGDGMGGNLDFSGISMGDPQADGKATVGIPSRLGKDRIDAMARVLGLDPANPGLVALMVDHESRVAALRQGFGDSGAARNGTDFVALEDAATAAARVDDFLARLAEAEDALVRDMATLAGTAPSIADAARDERAAERARCTRHATGLMNDLGPTGVCSVDLGGCIAASGLAGIDRELALQAWVAWAPSMRGACERWLATERSVAPQMAADEARMRSQAMDLGGDAPGIPEGAVAIAMDEDDVKRRDDLMQQASAALVAINEAALAGRAAVLAALPEASRPAFDAAWLRAAAPKVYADARDAMAKLDAALVLATLSPQQRQQVDALRGEHAARHGSVCSRIAMAVVATKPGGAKALGMERPKDINIQVSDGRFERAELNARTLRRLRSILSEDQRKAVGI